MIFLSILVFILQGALTSMAHEKRLDMKDSAKQGWLKGFQKAISGEVLHYHSPLPNVEMALLVRSMDRSAFIEWETEPIPGNVKDEYVTFMWMAGIDVNEDSHPFHLYIDDRDWFTFSNPKDTLEKGWCITGRNGSVLEFKMTMIDKYNDFMGYVFLRVPMAEFQAGKPLLIRIEGESAGSRTWYMTFEYRPEFSISIRGEPAIIKRPEGHFQPIRVDIIHMDEPIRAILTVDDKKEAVMPLTFGYNTYQMHVPAVREEKRVKIEVALGGKTVKDEDFLLKPVHKKDIYLLHHSHVDIGYTHVQSDVERLHGEYFEQVIELARRTQGYPEGARFKWNTEVLWAVDHYLEKASPEKKRQFIEAVQNGWIGLDGLYANELTGLCRPEELMRLLEFARKMSSIDNIDIDAAMITDIPGYTWGIVPVLAQSGIRYLSIGPNHGHRIGYILTDWADRPFYWVSPSGEEKVMCWVAGKGYSWFHTGLDYSQIRNRLKETAIFQYLSELEASRYPYDMIAIRYNIGSDNGPPDPMLSDIVKKWNEKYLTPKVTISTTSEMFHAFEEKYRDVIPAFSGDFTGHWEDGAASSARETALNRDAAERLVQAEALWAMHNPGDYPVEAFYKAWRNVLLFDEHTWGSWNSISDPEGDFTKQQWEIKRSFANKADIQSKDLIRAPFAGRYQKNKKSTPIDVYNTHSWQRTDLVILPEAYSVLGDRVTDGSGNPVPSQRLSSGELAILARDVPPFGAKRFMINKGSAYDMGVADVKGSTLTNGLITVKIDGTSGAVACLEVNGSNHNFVNRAGSLGLNDYFYVAGRNPQSPLRNGPVKIVVKEKGPLVVSLLIESDAPGCHRLYREVRLVHGLDRVDIINTMDKKKVLDPEGIHVAFPFHVDDGQMRMDIAWGQIRPDDDQLTGSCKNYFTIQRWVDISNQDYGITWATRDAPLIEVGSITSDPIAVGWKRRVEPSQTLYSYVMNNYWETNYKAFQEGPSTFRYAIRPHGSFNSGSAERFGIEWSQPLYAFPGTEKSPPRGSFLSIDPIGVIVTSLKPSEDGKAVMVRLFNSSGRPEQVKLTWGNERPGLLSMSSPFEERGEMVKGLIKLSAFGIMTLRAEGFRY